VVDQLNRPTFGRPRLAISTFVSVLKHSHKLSLFLPRVKFVAAFVVIELDSSQFHAVDFVTNFVAGFSAVFSSLS